MTISHSNDGSRDTDEKIAKIMGWTNLDWHFDRVVPMTTWLGGTPPGEETGYIEEIPAFSSDASALSLMLSYLSRRYDFLELYSDCGYWFCRTKDHHSGSRFSEVVIGVGQLTPLEAIYLLVLETHHERT